ncbi:MAG: hypothetical protein ACRDB0_06220 [Paraclostridium sp.]
MASFKFDTSGIAKGILALESRSMAALGLYGDSVAKKMEAYAKSNRPWTDRTSSARNRLTGTSVRLSGSKIRCNISHGVDYGIWLELCNERRYAVLKPTIDAIGPQAVSGLSKIFK